MVTYIQIGDTPVNPEAVDAIIPAKLPESGSRVILRSGHTVGVSDATPEEIAIVLTGGRWQASSWASE